MSEWISAFALFGVLVFLWGEYIEYKQEIFDVNESVRKSTIYLLELLISRLPEGEDDFKEQLVKRLEIVRGRNSWGFSWRRLN